MSKLKEVARVTLSIVEKGVYTAPSGSSISIADEVKSALASTRLYRPGDFDSSDLAIDACVPEGTMRIEVTHEGTTSAARRLVLDEGKTHVVALNFASARSPGGGFLNGAKAQEEDLARCSELYPCLISQMEYYKQNQENPSALYTDHAIYCADVPFFRGDDLSFLEEPFCLSIITSPAPNAGVVLQRDPIAGPAISKALKRRAETVLRIAAWNKHRILVLGAWGCGVFRNDPSEVASIFYALLNSSPYNRAFQRVVFAVYDRSDEQKVLKAFQKTFE